MFEELIRNEAMYMNVFQDIEYGKIRDAINFYDNPTEGKYWLSLPDKGIIVANYYKVALCLLCRHTALPVSERRIVCPATHALALVQSTLTVALQSRSSSATHALALALALSPATHALTFAMLLNLIDIDPFAEVVRMESNSSSSSIKRKRTGEEVEAKEKAKVLKVGISSGNNNNNGDGGIPTILSDPALLDCNGDIPLHISLIA
ncbi:hypothetical protein Sjap_018077 [Stephania japonica]|uniref:Uncharacterized protein n=1 Tax=Stephania japonica TaxID=461633 RepID=A0AAP0NIZ2_9MAGN